MNHNIDTLIDSAHLGIPKKVYMEKCR